MDHRRADGALNSMLLSLIQRISHSRPRSAMYRCRTGILVALVVLVAGLAASAQEPADARRSRQPLFSSQQAKRGKAQYGSHCAGCHQTDLSGGDRTPPLVGSTFQSTWAGRSVGDLFERVRTTMPQDTPGSLTRDVYLDIVAFLLESNEYPAGERELKEPDDALRLLRLD